MKDEELKIPYIAYESAMVRQERSIKRIWIICVILIAALIGSNVGWIYYESQWEVVEETTTQTVSQDSADDNYFIGGDVYGQTDGYDHEND